MPIDTIHAPDGNLALIIDKIIDHKSETLGDPKPLKILNGGPYRLIVPDQRKRGCK